MTILKLLELTSFVLAMLSGVLNKTGAENNLPGLVKLANELLKARDGVMTHAGEELTRGQYDSLKVTMEWPKTP